MTEKKGKFTLTCIFQLKTAWAGKKLLPEFKKKKNLYNKP